jgi:hypothetical protein
LFALIFQFEASPKQKLGVACQICSASFSRGIRFIVPVQRGMLPGVAWLSALIKKVTTRSFVSELFSMRFEIASLLVCSQHQTFTLRLMIPDLHKSRNTALEPTPLALTVSGCALFRRGSSFGR